MAPRPVALLLTLTQAVRQRGLLTDSTSFTSTGWSVTSVYACALLRGDASALECLDTLCDEATECCDEFAFTGHWFFVLGAER